MLVRGGGCVREGSRGDPLLELLNYELFEKRERERAIGTIQNLDKLYQRVI